MLLLVFLLQWRMKLEGTLYACVIVHLNDLHNNRI